MRGFSEYKQRRAVCCFCHFNDRVEGCFLESDPEASNCGATCAHVSEKKKKERKAPIKHIYQLTAGCELHVGTQYM